MPFLGVSIIFQTVPPLGVNRTRWRYKKGVDPILRSMLAAVGFAVLVATPLSAQDSAQSKKSLLSPGMWIGLGGGFYTVQTISKFGNGPGVDLSAGYMSNTGSGWNAVLHFSTHQPDKVLASGARTMIYTSISAGPRHTFLPKQIASPFIGLRASLAYRRYYSEGAGRRQERFGAGGGGQIGVTGATAHGFRLELGLAYDVVRFGKLGPTRLGDLVEGAITNHQFSVTLAFLIPL